MKRKIIVVIVIVTIAMGIAITSMSVYEAKKLRYTSDGKAIFIPGETDISDIPKGTQMVIGVVEEDKPEKMDIVQKRQEAKKKVEENKKLQENIVSNNTKYEVKAEDFEDNPFYQVLLKYNDKQEITEMIESVVNEDDELHIVGEETEVKPGALKMYNLVMEMMERKDVEENDKKILQEEYLDYVDNNAIEKAQKLENN